MTIHRIGKNPNNPPSRAALSAWPAGMPNSSTATARATTRETSPEIQAVILSPPSITNSTASGMRAHRALRVSESPTA